ncbi:SIS domain-containing protein [Carboxydochorda subterranea]|uniref:SIS domain-containing protein n=1 Tax=Carboxydichorda subterranea TaxID=3109565 RepID=A0ABZ1BVY3_9FIRM|nr:SIS domain-containing protein [Limnochorda sp. L945t]WRP16758.1 SIS domain-containing protein [Limnochorda sp. L945t]
MSPSTVAAETYLRSVEAILARIRETQTPAIARAGEMMATAIAGGRGVFVFGSGHSVIPVLDVFPRYGSFVGFYPLTDPRLMWFSPVGPGGARELLWLERKEGYVAQFLKSHPLGTGDVTLVFSHGGLNAAPVEVALGARERGSAVVAVTSLANARAHRPAHSSGKHLADVADVAIDNCTAPEDAQVVVEGWQHPVAAASTVAFVAIAQALVASTAQQLAARGVRKDVFVSPNVQGVEPGHNERIFEQYEAWIRTLAR